MRIIVHGNPVDGFSFIGPFADSVDIPERHTEPLDYWWLVTLDEPDRTISTEELDETERWHLADGKAGEGVTLWRDERGTAWAHSRATDTTYDLTNGLAQPKL